MGVKERLLEFINKNGITQSAFEKNVGFSTGFVSNMGDTLRPNNVNKIAKVYPDLNTAWLLTGEGNMLRSQTSQISGTAHGTSTFHGNVHAAASATDKQDATIDYKDKYLALLEHQNNVSLSEMLKILRAIEAKLSDRPNESSVDSTKDTIIGTGYKEGHKKRN